MTAKPRLWLGVGLFLLASLFWGASTQTSALASPFAVPGGESAAPSTPRPESVGAPGLVSELLAEARALQQRFYRDLPAAVRRVQKAGTATAATGLILLSFAYGVFHAVGPGHGKVVVSTYLLANERALRRGILLAFLSSLFQAITAIVAVGLVVLLLGFTARTTRTLVPWLETASYAAVALIGLWLTIRALWRLFSGHPAHSHSHTHEHGPHDHEHSHDHGCDEGCGHAHMPSPETLDTKGFWGLVGVALSVGIRPCTGAILVLVFAYTLGAFWIGAVSALAMSIGTALTVSLLALLALGGKRIAFALSGACAPPLQTEPS